MKTALSFLLLFLSLAMFAQEKETIYIKYDENREISDSLEKVYFHIKPRFFSSQYEFDSFTFDKQKHKAVKISYCDVKDKLISKKDANLKVEKYLERSAKEKSKRLEKEQANVIYKFNRYPIVYAFDSYFKKIYIYHVQSEILYEVNWIYSIE